MHSCWIRAPVASAAACALSISSAALAQDSYSDRAGSGAVAAAIDWLQGTLLGPVAAIVAIIAVAGIGFMMLTGRIDMRRAARVVLGCFIIFGASTIANGLVAAMASRTSNWETGEPQATMVPPPAVAGKQSVPLDPYAGAAVPAR